MNSQIARYDAAAHEHYAKKFLQDGFCILKNHFSKAVLIKWNEAFAPLLKKHIESEKRMLSRGKERFYVTLPFTGEFANPAIFEDEDILAIVSHLTGEDFVMCQLATDTPLIGSEYQEIHRDTQPLFPEAGIETPPFQLAINFPLVDVTLNNGPLEIIRGTHMISKNDGIRRLESLEAKIEPVLMTLGDVMIRDVRALHRGTPNHTDTPRPMVVIGYSRKWLNRPEVSIQIPSEIHAQLSPRARHMLRNNPVVDSANFQPPVETYEAFAY